MVSYSLLSSDQQDSIKSNWAKIDKQKLEIIKFG